MNHCIFEGRLTSDPELRYTASGTAIASQTIAVNAGKDQPAFFASVDFWEQKAEFLSKYFKKGNLIRVYCRAKEETWDDKTSGEKRSKVKFVANQIEFLPTNKSSTNETEVEAEETPKPAKKTAASKKSTTSPPEPENEDIPF